MADRVVVIGVVAGVREGVVSEELQALGESLVHFHLKGVVRARGIVTIIVTQRKRYRGIERAAAVLRSERRETVRRWSASTRVRYRTIGTRQSRDRIGSLGLVDSLSYCRGIDIVVWPIASKTVGALAAHICDFESDGVGELMLDSKVPGVHGRQHLLDGTDVRTRQTCSQWDKAVRGNCGERIRRIDPGIRVRPRIQTEERNEVP